MFNQSLAVILCTKMYTACRQSTTHTYANLRTYAIVCICIGIIGMVSVCQGNAIRRPATTSKTCAKFDEYCINHWDCCSNSCLSFVYRCTRNYAFYPFVFVGQNYTTQATLDDILQANFGSNAIATGVEVQQQQEPIDDDVKVSTTTAQPPVEPFVINIRLEENANGTGTATATDAATPAAATTDATSSAVPIVILNNQQEQQQSQQLFEEYMQTVNVNSNAAAAQSLTPTTTTKDAVTTTEPSTGETAQAILNITSTQTPTPSEATTTTATPTESTLLKTRSTAETAPVDCKEIGEKCYRHEECCTMRCHGFLHQCVT